MIFINHNKKMEDKIGLDLNLTLINKPDEYVKNEEKKDTHINKGTGAGGANTNVTGLGFERETDIGEIENSIRLHKAQLHKFMNENGYILNENYKISKNLAHGCKQPDEAYLFRDKKILFIIEKKFQQGSGSVAEKLQTGPFKKQFYQKIYPAVHICYIYILSDYFKTTCPRELEFLKENGIPYYFQEDNIVTNIKNFIDNYIKTQTNSSL